VERPQTFYAKSGDVSVAYQALGDGPFDLVLVPGYVSNVEYGWEEPSLAGFYRRLASFRRLIIFDKRGTGLSDRVSGVPDLETRMDDVRAIMDAVGSERLAVLGYSEGAAMAAVFAATYPERTPALVLYGAFPQPGAVSPARGIRAVVAGAIARRDRTAVGLARLLRRAPPRRRTVDAVDEAFRRWYATRLRLSASPAAAVTLTKMAMETDARPLLRTIHVRTLIVHRAGDRTCNVENARYAADQIPDAVYAELPGGDHLPWVGDSEAIVREIERFLTGIWERGGWEEPEPERVLATVLFTDIVGSTARAAELGHPRWREVLQEHHALVRRHLARFRGRELDIAGDGFFASFDGPGPPPARPSASAPCRPSRPRRRRSPSRRRPGASTRPGNPSRS